MPKFVVPVCRTAVAHRDIYVTSDTPEEARQRALEIAGNFEFSEKDAEYSAEGAFLAEETRMGRPPATSSSV